MCKLSPDKMVTFTAFTTAGRYFCNNNLFLENYQILGDENENDQNDHTSGENENNDLSRVDSSRTTTLTDTDSVQTGTRFLSTVPTGDHHHNDIYKITLKIPYKRTNYCTQAGAKYHYCDTSGLELGTTRETDR